MNLGVGSSQSLIYHNEFTGRDNRYNINNRRRKKAIPFSKISCPKCWRVFTTNELKSDNTILIRGKYFHWRCIMPEYMQRLQEAEIVLSQHSTLRLFQWSLIEATKKVLDGSFEEAENQLAIILSIGQEIGQQINLPKLMAEQNQGISP